MNDEMVKISFRIDRTTLALLKQLEAGAGPDVRGRRSILLRKLITEAANRGRTL